MVHSAANTLGDHPTRQVGDRTRQRIGNSGRTNARPHDEVAHR